MSVAMLDRNGAPLEVGDKAVAKATTFEGPTYLYTEILIIQRIGRTKVHVSSPRHYGERTWAVSPRTLERVTEDQLNTHSPRVTLITTLEAQPPELLSDRDIWEIVKDHKRSCTCGHCREFLDRLKKIR
jgi:hypothetical protein